MTASGEGAVHLTLKDGVAAVLFDRPQARNAMTWHMYERLGSICQALQANSDVRVVTFQGAGGESFVAGTDIAQFADFDSGDDGVDYERKIDLALGLIEALGMPTVAVLDGWTVGGGLAIATACDFRIATPATRMGVPIARTLGNCLSARNLARLVAVFGISRVKRMLMLAETITAQEALDCGFLLQVVESADLSAACSKLCDSVASLAPVTQRVTKEALRRLVVEQVPGDDDLIRQCYGSADFQEGVSAFQAKRRPVWTGA